MCGGDRGVPRFGGADPGDRAAPAAGAIDSQQTDPLNVLVGRLDLERYKATIKGLTRFGDRRQGTDRNRAAVDWIEAQLKSYGCANISRLKYTYFPSEAPHPSGPPSARGRQIGGRRTLSRRRGSYGRQCRSEAAAG